jgi:hypothetical protein
MMKKKKKRKSPLSGKGSNHLLRLHMEVKGEALSMKRGKKKRRLRKPKRRRNKRLKPRKSQQRTKETNKRRRKRRNSRGGIKRRRKKAIKYLPLLSGKNQRLRRQRCIKPLKSQLMIVKTLQDLKKTLRRKRSQWSKRTKSLTLRKRMEVHKMITQLL